MVSLVGFSRCHGFRATCRSSAAAPHSHVPFCPKISFFSGGPKETEYDIWRYEVLGLVADHLCSEEQILQAIRRSVKGEAARILMRMGHAIKVHTILAKFDACFGLVQEGQSVLAAFYNCKQANGEPGYSFR